jgi:hypothetical protein
MGNRDFSKIKIYVMKKLILYSFFGIISLQLNAQALKTNYYNAKGPVIDCSAIPADSLTLICQGYSAYRTTATPLPVSIHTEDSPLNQPFKCFEISKMNAWTYIRCRDYTQDGHTNWRLPVLSELQLIYTYKKELNFYFTAKDILIDYPYWSATQSSDNGIWYIDFRTGVVDYNTISNYGYNSRCVRDVIR